MATHVMRSSAPDALQNALANGWLSIVGDGEVAIWFGDLVRLARGRALEATAAKPAVAVIGLGRMGSGIAHSLLRGGFPVTVYNRTEEKMRPLVAAGATAAATSAEAARAANFVVTSLMSDASVFAVVEGPHGTPRGPRARCGSYQRLDHFGRRDPLLVGLHVGHGSEYLAAPVLGRPDSATAGELVALVCGKQSVLESSRRVIESYTRQNSIPRRGSRRGVSHEACGELLCSDPN